MNFAENVMLIDVALLNGAIDGARAALSSVLGRTLPDLDLPAWLSYLALDAGLREGENEIQVILIRDDATCSLKGCSPSELEQLRGQACRTPLGEFVFAEASPAGMTDTEDLFMDLMTLALDAKSVKSLTLLPDGNTYGNRVAERLQELLKDKEAACVRNRSSSPWRSLPLLPASAGTVWSIRCCAHGVSVPMSLLDIQ